MKRRSQVKKIAKTSSKDLKTRTVAKPPTKKRGSILSDETKALELVQNDLKPDVDNDTNEIGDALVIDEEKEDEDAEKKEEEEDVKPNISFDYCEIVARVDQSGYNSDHQEVKIKEEILEDGSSIEISEPKIHQEEIAIVVPRKTKHHPNVVVIDSMSEPTTTTGTDDRIEYDAQSYNRNMLDMLDEDESSRSSIVLGDDDDKSAKNILLLSLSDLQKSNNDESTSFETFINAFEEIISSKHTLKNASHCSFMELYGFIMTFRFVYELPKHKRDKDSEQAINILLSRYTGIDCLEVLQVLLEALNVVGDLDEFKPYDIQPVDCILITFLQLKVCITFKDIAKVFKCEEKVAVTCFYTTIKNIKQILKSVIYWPSREETEMTIPQFFKPAYSNVRTIFTTLIVQTNDMQQQQQYQKLRYVIGFAPSGFVSYISAGYNADTHNDEKIFRLEKLRQRFERNQDALMVLNGFPIENLLGVNNFRVFRPPFIVKKVLPDNKTIVRENIALFKHVTDTCSSLQKFQILSLQLKFPSIFVDEILFGVCVCINYNVMFQNT